MKTVHVQIDWATCGVECQTIVDTQYLYDPYKIPVWYQSRALTYLVPRLEKLGISVRDVSFRFGPAYWVDDKGFNHFV